MSKRKHCLALDLNDDPEAIAEYVEYHKQVWPEIEESLKEAGIIDMEIYLATNRLFMIIEVNEKFSFDHKKELDENNPVVQKWENIMRKIQRRIPGSNQDEWWLVMDRVYKFTAN